MYSLCLLLALNVSIPVVNSPAVSLSLQLFVNGELCNGKRGGANGREQRMDEWERWRLRHVTFPQCIKGTSLPVTHTVRTGRGWWREETGKGRGRRRRRQRWRGWGRKKRRERRGLEFFFCPQLTGWMHEWTGLSLLLLRWGRGWHRKPWGRRRAREGERSEVIKKKEREEEREFPWHLNGNTLTADLIPHTCEAVAIV